MKFCGCISLDIDGTVTDNVYTIPLKTLHFLKGLVEKGWHLIFITGRTFSFASHTLSAVDFPYTLAVQNGADILRMPEKTLLHRWYIDGSILPALDAAYAKLPEDYIIYSGFEKGDFCYFRPQRFSPEMGSYLQKLEGLSQKPWRPMAEFSTGEIDNVPLVKGFGSESDMRTLQQSLHSHPVETTVIKDPLSHLYVNLITHPHANKGSSLEWIAQHYKVEGPLIAAGDDENDIPMLKKAHVAISMENAPQHVKEHAAIVAPPASSEGIVEGIQRALRRLDVF